MVRSLENLPEHATFMMAFLAQASGVGIQRTQAWPSSARAGVALCVFRDATGPLLSVAIELSARSVAHDSVTLDSLRYDRRSQI
jgi:hypothetical protein